MLSTAVPSLSSHEVVRFFAVIAAVGLSGLNRFAYIIVPLVVCLSAPPAATAKSSRCINEACFDPELQLGETILRLRGTAKLTYLFFDVYAGALYVDPSVQTIEEVLAPHPKTLVLQYRYSISKEDLTSATKKLVKKNPQIDFARIQAGLDALCALYRDIEPGDRYQLSYHPGEGTSLSLNGTLLGTVPGDELAAAMFGIWVSKYSVDRGFTSKLLGN